MKNLKKVLALVLVVATLMGFATVASAKFTDDSSIKYDEAVEVMTLINVINGYTDGSFRPTANVTRAQMAKMVAYIVAGGEDVGSLYAGANSFPDCKDHWAKGYIAYANKTGIIAGTATGLFNPDGSVTGTQAAKMMLCALGYDATVEGYTGSNWAVNVLSDARDAGLLKNISNVDMSAALTREQAAQMMFNALTATMVKYDNKGSIIDLGNGASISTGASTAEEVVNNESSYKTEDKINADFKGTMQLCEKYFEDLKFDNDTSADEGFGRPSHSWSYNKSEAGPYSNDAEVVYTASTEAKDVEKDLKNYELATSAKSVDVFGATKTTTTIATVGDIAKLTGNGTIVEVYANSNKEITDVIVITPVAGTVTVKEVKATSSHGAYTQYSIGSYSGKIFSTIVDEDDDKDSAFLSGDIANKDFVTYYRDGNDNLYINPTTEMSGVLTAVGNDGKLTIDGTKYSLSTAKTGTFTPSKDEQTFAVDNYGYIVKVTEASSETRYGLVLKDATYNELVDGNKVEEVKAVLMATSDGKVETAKLADTATPSKYVGKVVSYTVSSKGVYDLKDYTSSATAISEITNGSSKLTSGMFASTSTMFVFANYEKDDDNQDVIAGTVTTYTGYKNVPSYKTLTTAWAVDTDETPDGIADVVFVYDNKTAAADDNYVYVKGTYSKTVDGVAYDVIIKGEESTITLNAADAQLKQGMYSKITVANGAVTEATPASTSYKAVKNNGGVLSAGASEDKMSGIANVADDAPVYYINTTDKVAGAAATADELTDAVTGDAIYIVLNDAKDTVTAIYILQA